MLGQARATQRHKPLQSSDEERLTEDIIALATKYGRYGYRRITALLNNERGWRVNHKRVERIWRREGLKVPRKQPKRSRLWLNDGSCIRLRPEYKDHVWSYDFMIDRTCDGKAFKILNIIDEYTRECLAILVARKIKAQDVIDILFQLHTTVLLNEGPTVRLSEKVQMSFGKRRGLLALGGSGFSLPIYFSHQSPPLSRERGIRG